MEISASIYANFLDVISFLKFEHIVCLNKRKQNADGMA